MLGSECINVSLGFQADFDQRCLTFRPRISGSRPAAAAFCRLGRGAIKTADCCSSSTGHCKLKREPLQKQCTVSPRIADLRDVPEHGCATCRPIDRKSLTRRLHSITNPKPEDKKRIRSFLGTVLKYAASGLIVYTAVTFATGRGHTISQDASNLGVSHHLLCLSLIRPSRYPPPPPPPGRSNAGNQLSRHATTPTWAR